jgi:hypothetical protein
MRRAMQKDAALPPEMKQIAYLNGIVAQSARLMNL